MKSIGCIACFFMLQVGLRSCMFSSVFGPPSANGTMWSRWYSSPSGSLQHAQRPFCSANSFADSPLEIFPPTAAFLPLRFCSLIRRASLFFPAHALACARDLSRFASVQARLVALLRSRFASTHEAEAIATFSRFAAAYFLLYALTFSGFAAAHAAVLTFAHALHSPRENLSIPPHLTHGF